jgi:hypothetical protein
VMEEDIVGTKHKIRIRDRPFARPLWMSCASTSYSELNRDKVQLVSFRQTVFQIMQPQFVVYRGDPP